MNNSGAILIALSVPAVVAFAGEPAVIDLRDSGRVTGAHIRLGDIADIRAGSEKERDRLASLTVSPAPALGTHRIVRRRDVAQALRRSVEAGEFVIHGASTKVERPATEYPGTLFVDAGREHLQALLARSWPDMARFEVAPVGVVGTVRAPVGEWRVTPRAGRESRLAKRTCVWVDLEIDGVIQRSIPVWFAVSAYRPVVVATRRYGSKEALAVGDFKIEERDVAGLRGTPLGDAGSLVGARARQPIPADAPVSAEQIEAQPPVRAHQEVDVRVVAGSIAIDTRAIAEEEGSMGKVIRVRNPASALTYMARVVGEGRTMATER